MSRRPGIVGTIEYYRSLPEPLVDAMRRLEADIPDLVAFAPTDSDAYPDDCWIVGPEDDGRGEPTHVVYPDGLVMPYQRVA